MVKIKAIQEQHEIIQQLQADVADLKALKSQNPSSPTKNP